MTKCSCCGQMVPEESPLRVDLDDNTVVKGGQSIHLQPRQAELLAILLKHTPQYLNHERIAALMFSNQDVYAMESIRVHVHRLRKTLEPLGYTVQNRFGVGYRVV